MLSDPEVARFVPDVPHPLTIALAVAWIEALPDAWNRRSGVVFAVALGPSGPVVGAVQLRLGPEADEAQVGFWIGRPFWGRGYATEAVAAVIRWAPGTLGLRRVWGCRDPDNPASGNVMDHAGMDKWCTCHEGGEVSYQYLVPGSTQ